MGNDDGGKSDGDGDKVGGQATASRAMARATMTRWQGPSRRQRSTSGAVGENDRYRRGRPIVSLGGQRPGPCRAVP